MARAAAPLDAHALPQHGARGKRRRISAAANEGEQREQQQNNDARLARRKYRQRNSIWRGGSIGVTRAALKGGRQRRGEHGGEEQQAASASGSGRIASTGQILPHAKRPPPIRMACQRRTGLTPLYAPVERCGAITAGTPASLPLLPSVA